MKQKINVVIHKNGSESGLILDCIGRINEGKANFSPRDLEGYLNIKKVYLPITEPGLKLVKDEIEPNTFHISEDEGKTFTLSLEWIEIYQLPEVDKAIEKELNPEDDLKEVFN